tara:strand:+ start:1192 stop:2580 length:1389 start_codon:yes stop_codon:yes gene_type:complete
MTTSCFAEKNAENTNAPLPVYLMGKADLEQPHDNPQMGKWIRQTGFKAAAGELQLLPGVDGSLIGAVFGTGSNGADMPFVTGTLARKLPQGNWSLENAADQAMLMALGFGLGSYRFDRYRKSEKVLPKLACPEQVDRAELERLVDGCFMARDLINTPVNNMGPDDLEQAMRALATRYSASVTTIEGDDLLTSNFPMIHAVGRASAVAPRLLDMQWGPKDAPKVTLVGKGVCFDTGGLDIKPAANMLLMKKDMGGAANVLGLALMIMDAGLGVRLRVLIPAVENSIAGNAFRPGDILTSRKGLTVEIGNTDAEGRLVLADALSYADEEEPQLLIDMATLTGAARVALGTDISPFYCHADALASDLEAAGGQSFDPLWRMPLYGPYDKNLNSPIADINNAPAGGMAGSIVAALFLNRFVRKAGEWAHFDIYGWNPKDKPESPVGGEAQAIRALYQLLRNRYPRP